jgi:hypothetical protein
MFHRPDWEACAALAAAVVNVSCATKCRPPECALGAPQPATAGATFYALTGAPVNDECRAGACCACLVPFNAAEGRLGSCPPSARLSQHAAQSHITVLQHFSGERGHGTTADSVTAGFHVVWHFFHLQPSAPLHAMLAAGRDWCAAPWPAVDAGNKRRDGASKLRCCTADPYTDTEHPACCAPPMACTSLCR